MGSSFKSAWQSFWHTMTSDDRHASHDSPYRTGQHVPLNQNRHAPLTSVATSAIESRPDLFTPFEDDPTKPSAVPNSQNSTTSPPRPYSPGMRSLSSQTRRSQEQRSTDGTGEIQMQSFHEGAPPPPPVSHSWKKIERWAEKNYEELFDQLCEGCTQNDVNELEHELDCSLPLEVRESLQCHDGQERGGLPTGIVFGCMLLDCEEIVQEWKNWRTVNEEFLSASSINHPQPPSKAYGGSTAASSSSSPASKPTSKQANPLWRQELLDKQESQPPRAIQKAYAHPGWIPLSRDWGGNNIAIDLAPGPAGKWGQVIIFGRDYDCKYVIARSWAAFLALLADDFESDFVQVDDGGELKLKPFKKQNVEPPYLEILRWRADQKYGRKPTRRRSANGLGVSTAANGKAPRDSPYGSPNLNTEERGRSPNRFPSRGPNASPKTVGVSSPLARVTEETSSPVVNATKAERGSSSAERGKNSIKSKKPSDLLDVSTPVLSGTDENSSENLETSAKSKQDLDKGGKAKGPIPSTSLASNPLGEMKNVDI